MRPGPRQRCAAAPVVAGDMQHASVFMPLQQDARLSCRSLRRYGERVPVRTGWITASIATDVHTDPFPIPWRLELSVMIIGSPRRGGPRTSDQGCDANARLPGCHASVRLDRTSPRTPDRQSRQVSQQKLVVVRPGTAIVRAPEDCAPHQG